ncbi:MAG: hypothetical protein KDC84_07235 [Crocinitomicaceae bacterium]|nr:hypothetical protein [Crocinitomicaceae bacterium]
MKNIWIILILFWSASLFAQDGVIHFTGNVKDLNGNKKLAGVKVTASSGGSVVKSVSTSGGGSFDFTVPIGKTYKVKFELNGYISKFINIDARNIIPEDLIQGRAPMNFEITIFEKVDGVDFSFLNNSPVADYSYDPESGYMIFDEKQMRNVRDQIQDKIEEMNALRAQEEMKVKNFNKLVAEGDKAFAKEAYQEALQKYQEAKALIPDDPTILIKVKEAEQKLEEQKQKDQLAKVEEEYQKAIKAGESAFSGKNYQEALNQYSKAAQLKPNEQLPTNKIIEIEEILKKLKDEQAAKEKLEKEYQNLITAGDNLFKSNDYENAKSKFQEALKLKPGESYPQEKITAIDALLKDQAANAEKAAKYEQLMKEAEGLLVAKNYENARTKFQEASNLMPKESLPKSKIAEIDEILSKLKEEQAVEEKYKKLLAEGDDLFAKEDYEGAKKKFQEALVVKAGEKYPTDKIAAIDKKLAELKDQKAQQEQYDNYISGADQLFQAKKYQEAKDKYNLALGIKQNAAYPIAQIKKCDDELKKLEDAAAFDKKYEQVLADADNLFNEKKYEESKKKYQEALTLKPTEKRPEAQIQIIDKLLKDIEDQKKIEESYKKLVADADNLFNSKDYNGAKGKYLEAQKVKPGEAYPGQKIQEIEQILLKEAANNKLEGQYQAFIKEADAFFNQEKWTEAKSKYTDALEIKKDEKYPKERIDLIAQKIAEAEAAKKKQEEYNKVIKVADDMFVMGNLEDAKKKYEEALTLKPNEAHPNNRIKEINEKLAGKMAAAEKEAKYKQLVADADKLLAEKKYNDAKSKYNEALSIKANEPYPTDKIQEINNILKDLEADKANLEAYNKVLAEADKLFGEQKYSDAITKYKEALSVRQNENYPQDQIKKITEIMKNEENVKNDEQYNKILKVADKYFTEQNFEKATELYNRALTFKPAEEYPRQKLKEIEDLKEKNAQDLAKLAALEKQYKELIAEGDQAFGTNNLDFAKSKYEEALKVKPTESYPQQKIDEINKLQNAQSNQAQLDKKYSDLVIAADAQFASAKYEEAIKIYEQAAQVKPNEKYPPEQIALANKRIKEAANEDVDGQYAGFIKTADEDFQARNYEAALNNYQSALELKPNELHPQNRVKELMQILEELAKADADKEARDRKYNAALQRADDFFNSEKYKEARTEYQRAVAIKNEAYPNNQIIVCDKKIKELNDQIDDAQIQKILDVADKKMEAEDYNKALELYKRVIGFRPGHDYANSKIAQINEILARLNAGKVELTDWGTKVDMDEDNLQLLIAKSQDNAKWQADTTVSNQKHKQTMLDQYRTENQVDANHQAKIEIQKVEADLKKAEENADDQRLNTTNEVVQFRTAINDKNNKDGLNDENVAHRENRKIENLQDAQIKEFEKSDDVRLNNELHVVAYNVELDRYQNEGDKLNYDGAVKTNNQVNNLRTDVDAWKQEADLNREDNSKRVDTYNYDLELDRNDRQAEQIALNYDQKNEINSVELEIANNNKDADVPRLDNSKKVVTYSNGLNEKKKADEENQYNDIDKTKNDINEYRVQTDKWHDNKDDNRQNNELNVIAYNTNLENEQRKQDDGFYDNITNTKGDIRDIETLIIDNRKDDDKPRENNTQVVNTYVSDLDNKNFQDKEKEKDKAEKTKIDINVLVDTKNRKDEDGANLAVINAGEVQNYTDDLAARKNKNNENEKDKIEETNNQIDQIKTAEIRDLSGKSANQLADDYPQGVTEEKFEKKNAKGVLIGYVTRRIVVQGDRGDVYEKIQTKFGTSFLKNGAPCTEFQFNNESAAEKLTK